LIHFAYKGEINGKYIFLSYYTIVSVNYDKYLWWIESIYDYANILECKFGMNSYNEHVFSWNCFDYFKLMWVGLISFIKLYLMML